MDDIAMTLGEVELIKTFEAKHKASQPWLFRG
jgi:3-isopropylmalate/(R)-2-methylmalate dehydratase small subunit